MWSCLSRAHLAVRRPRRLPISCTVLNPQHHRRWQQWTAAGPCGLWGHLRVCCPATHILWWAAAAAVSRPPRHQQQQLDHCLGGSSSLQATASPCSTHRCLEDSSSLPETSPCIPPRLQGGRSRWTCQGGSWIPGQWVRDGFIWCGEKGTHETTYAGLTPG